MFIIPPNMANCSAERNECGSGFRIVTKEKWTEKLNRVHIHSLKMTLGQNQNLHQTWGGGCMRKETFCYEHCSHTHNISLATFFKWVGLLSWYNVFRDMVTVVIPQSPPLSPTEEWKEDFVRTERASSAPC